MARRALTVLGARCTRQIPHGAAEDAVLDESHTLLRYSFEVERLRQATRIESVVEDRDLLVEPALAQPAAEVAALLQQCETAEGVEREVLQELSERAWRENGAIRPRLHLARVCGSLRDLDRRVGHGRWVDVANRPRGLLGILRRRVGGLARPRGKLA